MALPVHSIVEVEVEVAFGLEMYPLITFVKGSRSLIIADPGLVLAILGAPDMAGDTDEMVVKSHSAQKKVDEMCTQHSLRASARYAFSRLFTILPYVIVQ